MPRGIRNWTYKNVADFLKQHFFKLVNIDGSHHYYKGYVDGKEKLTDIQRHESKSILPRTLECTIHKSGIPKNIWKKWGDAGNKKARKKIKYNGAKLTD